MTARLPPKVLDMRLRRRVTWAPAPSTRFSRPDSLTIRSPVVDTYSAGDPSGCLATRRSSFVNGVRLVLARTARRRSAQDPGVPDRVATGLRPDRHAVRPP